MRQTLQNLFAEGKTAQVLETLRTLTTNDAAIHHQVLALSARFSENERQKHAGTLDHDTLHLERNRINAALLVLMEQVNPSVEGTQSQTDITPTANPIIQNAEKIYNINHIDNANFS